MAVPGGSRRRLRQISNRTPGAVAAAMIHTSSAIPPQIYSCARSLQSCAVTVSWGLHSYRVGQATVRGDGRAGDKGAGDSGRRP
jgi:hypothetical protein